MPSASENLQILIYYFEVGQIHTSLYLNAGFNKSFLRGFISRIFCRKVKMHRTPPTLRFSKVSNRSRAQRYVCKRTWAKELTSAPLQFFDHPESSPPNDYTCRKPFQGTPAWNIKSLNTYGFLDGDYSHSILKTHRAPIIIFWKVSRNTYKDLFKKTP